MPKFIGQNSKSNKDDGLIKLIEKLGRRYPPISHRRVVYFDELGTDEKDFLEARGYSPIILNSLPRNTDREEQDYILAKLQAIEEGTIIADKEQVKVLELQMKAHSMLRQESTRVNVDVKTNKEDIKELLDWGHSRHTLRTNSTVVQEIKGRKE